MEIKSILADSCGHSLRRNEILPKATDEGTFNLKSKCISSSQNVRRYLAPQICQNLVLPDNRIAAMFAVYISDNVKFGKFHIQSVINQQSVSQQRADSRDVLDYFRSLD